MDAKPSSMDNSVVPESSNRAEPAGRLATLVATVVSTVVLVLATIVLGLLATIIGWLPPRGNLSFHLARLWGRVVIRASGVRLRAHHEQVLDPRRGYVFMANHRSHYDVFALLATLPGQARFMAKRSLFKIPIFGWSLYASGFVPVDRGSREGARATFDASLDRLSRGASLVVFPEETRGMGGALLPLKPGGFLLALKSGHEIVPIGIRGSGDVQPKGSRVIRPGTIDLHYGKPIDPAAYGARGRKKLADAVRREIETLAGLDGSCPRADSRR